MAKRASGALASDRPGVTEGRPEDGFGFSADVANDRVVCFPVLAADVEPASSQRGAGLGHLC